jgi:hypothetical protein
MDDDLRFREMLAGVALVADVLAVFAVTCFFWAFGASGGMSSGIVDRPRGPTLGSGAAAPAAFAVAAFFWGFLVDDIMPGAFAVAAFFEAFFTDDGVNICRSEGAGVALVALADFADFADFAVASFF